MIGVKLMQTVLEAKRTGLIPEQWHDVIPDKCYCGGDFVISNNLKTTKCSNDVCYHKLGYRAADMLYQLGVRGIGEEYCKTFFRVNPNFKLHTDILTASADEHPRSITPMTRDKNVQMIRDTMIEPRTFRKVVSMLGLPKMKEVSSKLLFGINSYEEMVESIHKERQPYSTDIEAMHDWVAYKLRTTGVKTIETVTHNLLTYEVILSTLTELFNITSDAKEEIVIAMTGSPTLAGMTKDRYITYLNEIGEGIVTVRRKDSVSGVKYVLADSPSNSSKYIYGRDRGILITSVEFEELILSKINNTETVRSE